MVPLVPLPLDDAKNPDLKLSRKRSKISSEDPDYEACLKKPRAELPSEEEDVSEGDDEGCSFLEHSSPSEDIAETPVPATGCSALAVAPKEIPESDVKDNSLSCSQSVPPQLFLPVNIWQTSSNVSIKSESADTSFTDSSLVGAHVNLLPSPQTTGTNSAVMHPSFVEASAESSSVHMWQTPMTVYIKPSVNETSFTQPLSDCPPAGLPSVNEVHSPSDSMMSPQRERSFTDALQAPPEAVDSSSDQRPKVLQEMSPQQLDSMLEKLMIENSKSLTGICDRIFSNAVQSARNVKEYFMEELEKSKQGKQNATSTILKTEMDKIHNAFQVGTDRIRKDIEKTLSSEAAKVADLEQKLKAMVKKKHLSFQSTCSELKSEAKEKLKKIKEEYLNAFCVAETVRVSSALMTYSEELANSQAKFEIQLETEKSQKLKTVQNELEVALKKEAKLREDKLQLRHQINQELIHSLPISFQVEKGEITTHSGQGVELFDRSGDELEKIKCETLDALKSAGNEIVKDIQEECNALRKKSASDLSNAKTQLWTQLNVSVGVAGAGTPATKNDGVEVENNSMEVPDCGRKDEKRDMHLQSNCAEDPPQVEEREDTHSQETEDRSAGCKPEAKGSADGQNNPGSETQRQVGFHAMHEEVDGVKDNPAIVDRENPSNPKEGSGHNIKVGAESEEHREQRKLVEDASSEKSEKHHLGETLTQEEKVHGQETKCSDGNHPAEKSGKPEKCEETDLKCESDVHREEKTKGELIQPEPTKPAISADEHPLDTDPKTLGFQAVIPKIVDRKMCFPGDVHSSTKNEFQPSHSLINSSASQNQEKQVQNDTTSDETLTKDDSCLPTEHQEPPNKEDLEHPVNNSEPQSEVDSEIDVVNISSQRSTNELDQPNHEISQEQLLSDWMPEEEEIKR